MRYYIYCAVLITVAIMIVTFLPTIVGFGDKYLIGFEIPQNNSAVAGIQKYNTPPVSRNFPKPILSARAVLLKDLGTDTILYQKDASISVPIASTTKIMTALVASEYFNQNSILTVKDASKVNGTKVGLKAGENLNFRSLLYGMLLSSGNDAAYAIAENYPGGVSGFVFAMNKKATSLNLTHTQFDNPAGFDSSKHYSSANDMAIITQQALTNPQLAKIFATKETNIVSIDKRYNHELVNLNKLLSQVRGVLGVKTGFTEAAKENLVTFVSRDNHQILTVILGSNDRFGESTKLIEWAYSNYEWQ